MILVHIEREPPEDAHGNEKRQVPDSRWHQVPRIGDEVNLKLDDGEFIDGVVASVCWSAPAEALIVINETELK